MATAHRLVNPFFYHRKYLPSTRYTPSPAPSSHPFASYLHKTLFAREYASRRRISAYRWSSIQRTTYMPPIAEYGLQWNCEIRSHKIDIDTVSECKENEWTVML